MADSVSAIPEFEEEETLIAAAKQIAMALGSKRNLTGYTRKILLDLGVQLSKIAIVDEPEVEEIKEIEDHLDVVQKKIMSWEEDQPLIWESDSNGTCEYLNTAEEVQSLIEKIESLSSNGDGEEVLRKAHDVLQVAMVRVEEQFKSMLFENRQPYEPESMSFQSIEEDGLEEGSLFSFGDDSFEEPVARNSISRNTEQFIIDLIHPAVLPVLKNIVNVMFNSNYDQECIQAYTNSRQEALEDSLFSLEMEKLSIEEVLKMEWVSLNSKIRKWHRAMKIFVRVYLSSEKCLSDQLFWKRGSISVECLVDSSKASMLQLLNFGEAMTIGPHNPEKLSAILDMYEVLNDLLPDIDGLYTEEAGSSIRIEYHEVLKSLGESVRSTFLQFENAVATNKSPYPFAGGGIHPLTKYVLNYLRILTDYSDILNFLIKDKKDEVSSSITEEDEVRNRDSSTGTSPMGTHFLSIAQVLELNLEEKSKLYREIALQHFFLMNNIHYMAQKVRGSELRIIFGDEWIRKHNRTFQQHAMKYERASWSTLLSFLKEDGIHHNGSKSVSKNLLKEMLRRFYLAFEEIYKTQTSWIIPHLQLREDLRISISVNVIQAYRIFVGRHSLHVNDKIIKYSADDLEDCLTDLFEGSSKSLLTFKLKPSEKLMYFLLDHICDSILTIPRMAFDLEQLWKCYQVILQCFLLNLCLPLHTSSALPWLR